MVSCRIESVETVGVGFGCLDRLVGESYRRSPACRAAILAVPDAQPHPRLAQVFPPPRAGEDRSRQLRALDPRGAEEGLAGDFCVLFGEAAEWEDSRAYVSCYYPSMADAFR